MREQSKPTEALSSTASRPFICGIGGTKDQNGLPERIYVCPAEGSDVMVAYQRVDRK